MFALIFVFSVRELDPLVYMLSRLAEDKQVYIEKNYFLILSTFENHGNISSFTQNYPLPDVDFP